MEYNSYVIIVAAGNGSRMQSDVPKQFMLLNDLPVLMWTISQFANSAIKPKIIVVLSENIIPLWTKLCEKYRFTIQHEICIGGKSRFQSVKNGLNYLDDHYQLMPDDAIAVHDGARPIISTAQIKSIFECCTKDKPAVVLAIQSSNSVRIGNLNENNSVSRELVWLIQTPQVFKLAQFKAAYQQEESPLFTDDASVIENSGVHITIHPGDHRNIKITFKDDLEIVQNYLKHLS